LTRSSRFKQEMPSLQLSVECGTPAVPNDGRFHVLLKGDVRYSSASQRSALEFYKRERDRLFGLHGRPEPPTVDSADRQRWIQEQRLEFDLRAMNQELAGTVVANARRKGGKGR
jgi:hypothetical protein